MPFVLVIIGSVLLITSIKNTYGTKTPQGSPGLGGLLQGDFTGTSNFTYWVFALLIIGSIGYIPKLKPVSNALLGLVILVLVLTKGNPSGVGGGFFAQLTQQLGTTTTAQTTPSTAATTSGITSVLNSLPAIPGIG
jgi:hypothetical protein